MKWRGIHSIIPDREEPEEEILALIVAYGRVYRQHWQRTCTLTVAAVLGGLVFLGNLVPGLFFESVGSAVLSIASAVLCLVCLVWLKMEKLGRPRIRYIAKGYWPVEVITLSGTEAIVCNARRAGEAIAWFHWDSRRPAQVIQAAAVPAPDLEAEKKFASDLLHALTDLRSIRWTSAPSPILQRDTLSFGQVVALLQQCIPLEDRHREFIASSLFRSILSSAGEKDKHSGCEVLVRELTQFRSDSPSYLADLSRISHCCAEKLGEVKSNFRNNPRNHKALVPAFDSLVRYRESIPGILTEAERLCQPVLETLQEEQAPYQAEIVDRWTRESNGIKATYRNAVRQCEFEMHIALGRIAERIGSLKEKLTFANMDLEQYRANVSDQYNAWTEEKAQARSLLEELDDIQRKMRRQDADVSALQARYSSVEMRYYNAKARAKDLGRRLTEERNRLSTVRAKKARLQDMIEMEEYRAQQTKGEFKARMQELRSRGQEEVAEVESRMKEELNELWKTRLTLQKAQKALELLVKCRDPGDTAELARKASLEDDRIWRTISEFKTRALDGIGTQILDKVNQVTGTVRTSLGELHASVVDLDNIRIDGGQYCLPIWMVFYSIGRGGPLQCTLLGPQMTFELIPSSPFKISRLEDHVTHQELLEALQQDIGDSFEYFLDFAKKHDFLGQTPRFQSVVVPKLRALARAGVVRKSLVDLVIQDIGE
jgi:predicted  nucleic acid-binding Zn-ribbon protein